MALGAVGLFLVPTSARADSGPASFSGSSDAFGLNLTITVPGGPITSTPVDSGGPTAQTKLTSFGTSEAYAAFPDPGQTVVSTPTLLQGLLSGGTSGLPPINIPPPPSYPFFVDSEAGTRPSDHIGAGPYSLDATSTESAANAEAVGGLQDGISGNAALVTSKAGVAVQSDNSVVADATSDLQGLTIGPIKIGEVRSNATETASPDGTVTPSTDLEITGMQVGGLPVALSPTGLNVAGLNGPLPLNPTLEAILANSGLTATVVRPQTYPGEVTAPALQLTGPVNDLGAGTGNGTFTLTIGGGEAAMQTGAGIPAISSMPASQSGADAGSTSSSGGAPGSTADTMPSPAVSPGSASVTPAIAAAPTGRPTRLSGRALELVSNPLGFDIRSLYLVFAAAALITGVAAQLLRGLGVRGPWTSSGG